MLRTAKLLNTTVATVIKTATVDRGEHVGRVGKFYTDEQNINWAVNNAGAWRDPARGAVALASSWGTWQQTMRWYLPMFPRETWYQSFNLFLSSEPLQAVQAEQYLIKCGALTEQSERLTLSRYNAGETTRRVTSYGNDCFAILHAVRQCGGLY